MMMRFSRKVRQVVSGAATEIELYFCQVTSGMPKAPIRASSSGTGAW